MINYRIYLLAVIIFLLSVLVGCQKQTSMQFKTLLDDNANFPYLDENYQIQQVEKINFDSARRAVNYRWFSEWTADDSLKMVLSIKHGGLNQAWRSEWVKLNFSWDYLYYELRLSKVESQGLMKKLGFQFRYDLRTYFREEIYQSKLKTHYLDRLREICYAEGKEELVFRFMRSADLMDYAFQIGAKQRFFEAQRKKGIEPHGGEFFDRQLDKIRKRAETGY